MKKTSAAAPKRTARNAKSLESLNCQLIYEFLRNLGVSEYNTKLITKYIEGEPIKGLPIEPIKKVKKKKGGKSNIYNDTKYRHFDTAFIEIINKIINKLINPSYELSSSEISISRKDQKIQLLLGVLVIILSALPSIAQELKAKNWDVRLIEFVKEVVTRRSSA